MGGWEKNRKVYDTVPVPVLAGSACTRVGKNAADALWNIQWNVSALFCLPAFALPVPRFDCYLLLLLLLLLLLSLLLLFPIYQYHDTGILTTTAIA